MSTTVSLASIVILDLCLISFSPPLYSHTAVSTNHFHCRLVSLSFSTPLQCFFTQSSHRSLRHHYLNFPFTLWVYAVFVIRFRQTYFIYSHIPSHPVVFSNLNLLLLLSVITLISTTYNSHANTLLSHLSRAPNRRPQSILICLFDAW